MVAQHIKHASITSNIDTKTTTARIDYYDKIVQLYKQPT